MWMLVYVGYERACVLQYKQDVFGHRACIVNQPAQLHMYIVLLRNPTAIFRCCPPCSWPPSSHTGCTYLPASSRRSEAHFDLGSVWGSGSPVTWALFSSKWSAVPSEQFERWTFYCLPPSCVYVLHPDVYLLNFMIRWHHAQYNISVGSF